jgi:hypothetical protein
MTRRFSCSIPISVARFGGSGTWRTTESKTDASLDALNKAEAAQAFAATLAGERL